MSSSSSNTTIIQSTVPQSRIIIFYTFITLLIPSLVCSLLIFYYFIRTPQLRKKPTNHIILLLLIVLFIEALTDLPIRLYYLHENTVLIHTARFCLFWNWNATILNIIGLHLMALASIERHLFVFHGQFLARHRLFLSRLPMIFCVIYPVAFYTSVVFGSWWCTNTYDYSSLACGAPCYLITSAFFSLFGILTHHVLPVFIVLFANLCLIIRVWQQKAKMNRANTWRKNVRMCVQLLLIAFIYLIVWFPQCVFFLMLGLGQGQIAVIAGSFIYEYTGNFTSFTVLFCPFVTLVGLPHVQEKIREDLRKMPFLQNMVHPNRIGTTNDNPRVRTVGRANARTQ